MIALPPVASYIASTMYCGLISESSESSYWSGYFSCHPLIRSHQPSRRDESLSSARYSRTSFGRIFAASPTIGMWAGTFFEISAGSTSMWMNLARGANSDSLPVTRSSKRAPIAQTRSASSIE
jgi:hypothetical protein